MAFDSKEQRRVFSHFATGVTVVTTDGKAGSHGLTANAVASLSLDPPLMLVAVEKKAHSHQYIRDNRCFACNILSAEQAALSKRFATPGPKDFDDIPVKKVETGAPVFTEALGFVDCRVVEILPGGDHDIFVGEIVAGDATDGEPLLYFRGKYARLAEG